MLNKCGFVGKHPVFNLTFLVHTTWDVQREDLFCPGIVWIQCGLPFSSKSHVPTCPSKFCTPSQMGHSSDASGLVQISSEERPDDVDLKAKAVKSDQNAGFA